MACPQKENGYTAIANEIMEALARIRINGEARQVLDFIFRKTYGFNKKQDRISLSQFSLGTGLPKKNICRAIKKLINMNIILKIENDDISIYRFNKDFDQWKPFSKLPHVAKLRKGVLKIENKSFSKLPHTIVDNTKDNITKVEAGKPAQPDNINILMNEFKPINPTINFGNKTQRSALKDMLRQFGYDKLLNTIKFAISIQGQKYAPTITTPYQLKENMGKLLIYYKREESKKPLII